VLDLNVRIPRKKTVAGRLKIIAAIVDPAVITFKLIDSYGPGPDDTSIRLLARRRRKSFLDGFI
jgi:hypothetical protein